MANVTIALKDKDRVVMQRQEGGSYVLRLYRDGNDMGLLSAPSRQAGTPLAAFTVGRGTTLQITGGARGSSLEIPTDIDFAPRIEIDTSQNLHIEGGSFIVAKGSRHSAVVTSTQPVNKDNATLEYGGSEDGRFPREVRVMSFLPANERRNVAVEEGAPGVQIVDEKNKLLFNFSGKENIRATATKLGVPVPTAPAAVAPQAPARPGDAPVEPPRAANSPLDHNQKMLVGSLNTSVKNMAGLAANAPEDVKKAYERIKASVEALNDKPNATIQDVRNLSASLATEMRTLQGMDNRAAKDISSILGSKIKTLDNIAIQQVAPPQRAIPGPQVNPAVGEQRIQAGQLQNMAGNIERQAKRFVQQSDDPGRKKLMETLAAAATNANNNPTADNMRIMAEALDKALDASKKAVGSPRAGMQTPVLERLQQNLKQLRDSTPMGAVIPNMPDSVLAAANAALDPRVTRQGGAPSDQNSIVLSGGIPGAGNTRFRG